MWLNQLFPTLKDALQVKGGDVTLKHESFNVFVFYCFMRNEFFKWNQKDWKHANDVFQGLLKKCCSIVIVHLMQITK